MKPEKAATAGYWTGPRPPYGYDLIASGHHRVLRPNAAAGTVRDIFARVERGATLGEVAEHLRAAGIDSPSGRPWTANAVSAIVNNPAYAGLLRRGRHFVAAQFEGIVSETTWDQACLRLRDPAIRQRRIRERAQEQRAAFEEGFWHHQRIPRGTRRIGGEWPRYILGPSEELPRLQRIVEMIAEGESLLTVDRAARETFPDTLTNWADPAAALRKSIERFALHPTLAGYTVWGHATSQPQLKTAQWQPFVDRDVWTQATGRWKSRHQER